MHEIPNHQLVAVVGGEGNEGSQAASKDCVAKANILGETTRGVVYTALATGSYFLFKKKAAGALIGGIVGNLAEGTARTAVNTMYLKSCK